MYLDCTETVNNTSQSTTEPGLLKPSNMKEMKAERQQQYLNCARTLLPAHLDRGRIRGRVALLGIELVELHVAVRLLLLLAHLLRYLPPLLLLLEPRVSIGTLTDAKSAPACLLPPLATSYSGPCAIGCKHPCQAAVFNARTSLLDDKSNGSQERQPSDRLP